MQNMVSVMIKFWENAWGISILLIEKVESDINMLDNIYKKILVILFHSNINILLSKSKHNKNIYKPCLWVMHHTKLVIETILDLYASNGYQP